MSQFHLYIYYILSQPTNITIFTLQRLKRNIIFVWNPSFIPYWLSNVFGIFLICIIHIYIYIYTHIYIYIYIYIFMICISTFILHIYIYIICIYIYRERERERWHGTPCEVTGVSATKRRPCVRFCHSRSQNNMLSYF